MERKRSSACGWEVKGQQRGVEMLPVEETKGPTGAAVTQQRLQASGGARRETEEGAKDVFNKFISKIKKKKGQGRGSL